MSDSPSPAEMEVLCYRINTYLTADDFAVEKELIWPVFLRHPDKYDLSKEESIYPCVQIAFRTAYVYYLSHISLSVISEEGLIDPEDEHSELVKALYHLNKAYGKLGYDRHIGWLRLHLFLEYCLYHDYFQKNPLDLD